MNFLRKIFPKIFATVVRDEQRELQEVYSLIVRRIDADLAEIKWPRINRARPCPMFAAIFRSKNAAAFTPQIAQCPRTAFVTLGDRHDYIWFARGNSESDSSSLRWKSATQFLPRRTAVCAFENSPDIFAVGRVRAGNETPRRTLTRVKRRIDNLRIVRIENHVATAGARVVRRIRLQDQLPVFA